MVDYREEAVDRCQAAGACAGDAEDAGIVAVGGDAESGSQLGSSGLCHTAVQVGDGVVAEDDYGTGHGHARHTAGTHKGDGPNGTGIKIELVIAVIALYESGNLVVSRLLVGVAAHRLFLGSRVCLNLDRAARAEHRAAVHARDDIAEHHVHCQRRANARGTAGDRTRQHIGADQLIRQHLDVAASCDADAAADHRADRAVGIVSGCGSRRGNRRGFVQIVVALFVDFKVFATVRVFGGCRFVIIEVPADVSGFGVELALIVAKLDGGLLDAIAGEFLAQTVHTVACGVAAGASESIVHKAVGVKAAHGLLPVGFLLLISQRIVFFLCQTVSAHEQSVGGILRQLAARNGHHDGGANACPAADCRGTGIAEHITLRVCLNVHGAIDDNIVLSLAAQETSGNGVVQHIDNRRHAHCRRAAECAVGRHRENLGIIQCGYVQLFRCDGYILLCLGTGDLLGDDDIHRSGDGGRAADAGARDVGGDELHGVRRQLHVAARLNRRAFGEFRHGAAIEPGDHRHRGNSHTAGHTNSRRHIEQVGAAERRHVHIAPGSHAAAELCGQVVFKGQGACAHAYGHVAAHSEIEGQQVHVVGRLRRGLDAAAGADDSAAYACFHGLIIDHGHNRGADADFGTGGNAACHIIYVCFVGAFYGSLRVVAGCFLRCSLRIACQDFGVCTHRSLDGVLEHQGVHNAGYGHSFTCAAADGCHHKPGVRVGADDHASALLVALFFAVGRTHTAVAPSLGFQGHVVSDVGENRILHHHGGSGCAHAYGAAANGHAARDAADADPRFAGDGDAVPGGNLAVVADLGFDCGLGNHNGDGTRDCVTGGLGACQSRQNNLVAAAGQDSYIPASVHGHADDHGCGLVGVHGCGLEAADGCGHGLLEHTYVDRSACRKLARAARVGCHGNNLLHIAQSQHIDVAVRRCDSAAVAHDCLGVALTDQYADDARRGTLIQRRGDGSQNIGETLFAFRLDGYVLCRGDNRAAANLGVGLIPGNRCREGAACRGAIAYFHLHGGGDKNQIGYVLSEDTDACLVGGERYAVANGGIHLISGDDHIQRAADGCRTLCQAVAENTGYSDRENVVLRFGADCDIPVSGDRGTFAHAGIDLASVVKARNVHANACRVGGSQRAADDTGVHAAACRDSGFPADERDGCVLVNLRAGFVSREEHGERAGHRSLCTHAGRSNRAGNGFHVVVYGGQIVQHIDDTQNIFRSEIYLNAVVLLIANGSVLALADVDMDQALVVGAGLIHTAVGNGEQIGQVEGEHIVLRGNRLLFRLDFQALGGDVGVLADFCQILVVVIDEGKGRADAHGGAACDHSAGSDGDSGLLHRLDHNVNIVVFLNAAFYHSAFQNLGAALSVGLHHGYGACQAGGLALAAHGSRQGLGCQKAREPVVQILSENGVGFHAVVGGKLAGQLRVSLVVIDADRHGHGDHIRVDRRIGGSRDVHAGGVGAVVRAVFRLGVHALSAVLTVHQRLGLVRRDIDAHSRGDIHGVLIELVNALRGSAGAVQSLVRGAVVRSGSVGQVQAQHAQHQGHQGAVADARRNRTILGRGNFVEFPHDLVVDDAGGGVVGEVRDTEEHSDLFEVAVKARAVGQGEGLGLILVQSFRINKDPSSYVSLPVKLCLHIGSGEIDGNGASHSGGIAGGIAGGGGVGLTALPRVQVQVRLLVDTFAIFIYADPRGVDDIVAVQGQPRALIDRGDDGVLDDVQRGGSIHSDVLGAGIARGRNLSDAGGLIVGEGRLSSDGILTRYGHRVDIVMDNGLNAEGLGGDDSVLAHAGLCLGVHIGHGEGRAHAYASAAVGQLLAGLVLDGQAVVGSGGGSGGVDLIGGLGVQLQIAGKLHLVLLVPGLQIGEDGLGFRLEDGQGKAARHAHVGCARAGDGGGADAVAHIFQLTGVAVLGGKLGHGSFQQEVQTDRGNHLLLRQFLTDFVGGCRVVQQGSQQEFGVEEQVCQIGKQAVCQSHRSGGDGAQRIALDIGDHDLEEHVLHFLVIGKVSSLTVLFIVLVQELLVRPVFIVEVA